VSASWPLRYIWPIAQNHASDIVSNVPAIMIFP
jgi:hypothetical protein